MQPPKRMIVRQQLFVTLEQDSEGYPPWDEEELWGERVGSERYRLTVTPTFARGLSEEDVVHVVPFGDRLYIDEVTEAGGHSTIRVILFDDAKHDDVIRICKESGCDARHTEIPGLFAIDIPPEASFERIRSELERGRLGGWWDVDEAAIAADH